MREDHGARLSAPGSRPSDGAACSVSTHAGFDPSRTPTHERLPTREMIDAIEDVDALRQLLAAADAAAQAIEVDLDFRSEGDEVWEARARKALTAHRICIGNLERRIRKLTHGGKVPDPVKVNQTKAERKAAQAALEAAQAENKRMRQAEEREKSIRLCIDFARRQSILFHFHQVAIERLGRRQVGELMNLARERFEASLIGEFPASAIEAASAGETANAGSTEGESAAPKEDARG